MKDKTASGKIFATFEGGAGEPSLPDLCRRLFREQASAWPQFREGCRLREDALLRDIPCPGFTLKAQWNPKRIVSTGARLDPASIRARPCFLCQGNLPEAQQAILYRSAYFILCNPAPIFPQHFTIAHIDHRPQSIEPVLDAFLTLIRDFSPGFTVFYNGPQSGASAPDHLHFQAVPAGLLPVEDDIRREDALRKRKQVREVDVFTGSSLGRAVLVLEGAGQASLYAVLSALISAMGTVLKAVDEPGMNLMGQYRNHRFYMMLFPRMRTRPSVYDRPGEDRVLISPGGAEMGGWFVTPVEKDFRLLDAGLARTIFADVSVDEETLSRIVDALAGC